MNDPRTLTDEMLIETVARLAARSRETTAELLAHLIVLEERNLHLACGFSSMFAYCRAVLRCSEGATYDRVEAARAARRFPVLLAMLAQGSLHLTAVRLLAPHLKGEDHLALVGGAIHKSAQEIRELLARWFPQADVATSVRKLPTAPLATEAGLPRTADPAPRPRSSADADTLAIDKKAATTTTDGPPCRPGRPARTAAPPAPARTVEPLAPDRYAFRFTGDAETAALLREARDLLSHTIADGDVALIFKRALGLLVEDARRRRFASTGGAPRTGGRATSGPGTRSTAVASRHIPAAIQRHVWDRDGGQCSFVAATGRRCDERRFLQYHHLEPWIVGGPASTENIALRCRAHNQYEAKVYFAPIWEAMREG